MGNNAEHSVVVVDCYMLNAIDGRDERRVRKWLFY
mgnify:CR=1 FL=1